jgi:hypothetical protein
VADVPRPGWIHALLPVIMLGACSAPDGNNVRSAEAGDWLYKACGVRLLQAPVLVANDAGARRRAPESASGSVAVPEADMLAVLDALRLNRTLHLRGQSETRFTYESADDVLPEKSCEIDKSQHVLYFRYRE